MTNETYVPIINASYLNANGFLITNNATTPNTKIDISAGLARDQTNTYDINLGNYLGANPGLTADTSTTLNATIVGAGGIDTGSLGASSVYYVYVILKNTYEASVIISLTGPATGPTMPYNYLTYRHIGYVVTDSSSHFLVGYWQGTRNSRMFMYDAPIATAITAGSDTSYTDIALTAFVPAVQNTPVWIYSALTPAAASRQLFMQPVNGTGNAVIITGQVTSVVVSSNSLVLARLESSLPKIAYKVSAGGGDAVAINVAGFEYDI